MTRAEPLRGSARPVRPLPWAAQAAWVLAALPGDLDPLEALLIGWVLGGQGIGIPPPPPAWWETWALRRGSVGPSG
jgi:hypothetical protein